MKVEFAQRFYKDLNSISNKLALKQLQRIIEDLEKSENLKSIPNLKKLSGFKNAYRIRMGNYRLGFFLENNTILLARILDRKDIYKKFP